MSCFWINCNCRNSKFETWIWPITDTECQVWAQSAKLFFLTVHLFKFKSIRKKPAAIFYFKLSRLYIETKSSKIKILLMDEWITFNFWWFFISFSNISLFWSKLHFEQNSQKCYYNGVFGMSLIGQWYVSVRSPIIMILLWTHLSSCRVL